MPPQVETSTPSGIAVGLNKGHAVTKRKFSTKGLKREKKHAKFVREIIRAPSWGYPPTAHASADGHMEIY